MENKKIKFLSLLILLPFLIFFWPVQLYGETSYIMLLGNSMYPTIESGTFVVVKPEPQYYLGDIVAFVNEDNRNVIHRIVEETEQGFITKGDNNDRNDPGFVTSENMVGRTLFVVPYMGFTSLFLQTPIGMSIFGIWILVMFAKNRPKKNKTGNQESFIIFKIAFASVLINYILIQTAIGIDYDMTKVVNIPFTEYFEPSIANTLLFSLFSMAIFMLYYFVQNLQSKNSDEIKSLKLIFSLGGIMILVLQSISIIRIVPFFINIINEQELFPSIF